MSSPSPSGRTGRLAAAAPLAVVAAVIGVFFAPALLGPDELVHRDAGRMHAPMKRWIGEELSAGRFPAWNPYAGLGTPVVANATDAVQHPFTLLLVVLPPAAALKAWVLLSIALGAAGAFAWARALGRTPWAAAAAATAFALSGPLVSSSDNLTYLTTYATLPWIFAAAHRHATRGGPGRLALVAVASAACAAAGDPQAWGFAVALVPPYALLAAGAGERRRGAGRGLAAAGAAILAAAPFLLPILAWIPHSDRAGALGGAELERWNLHPRRLPELLLPALFRGTPGEPTSAAFVAYAGNERTLAPWFLSIYAGVSVALLAALGAWRDRRARVCLAAAAAFAWAALGPHGGFDHVARHLPLLGSFRFWEKLAVWIGLLVALAAAHGCDALRDARDAARAGRVALAGAAFLLAVAGVAALAPDVVAAAAGGPPGPARALAGNLARGALHGGVVLSLLGLVTIARSRGALERLAPGAIGAILVLDLFGGNAGAYVLGPAQRLDPPPLLSRLPAGATPAVVTPFVAREDRWPELGWIGSTWEWSRRTLAPSWNVAQRVRTHHDYVALREARWSRYRAAAGEATRAAELGLFGFGYVVVPKEPALAARAGVPAPWAVAGEDQELPAFLVEIPHRPRAYVASDVVEADGEEALAFVVAGGDPLRTVVEGSSPSAASARGSARVVRDLATEVEVEALADGRALLVLNDAFAPGWEASVDGAPAPIHRVNAVVRGVWLDGAGVHRVRFRYRTPGLAAGWTIAACGGLALAAWALAARLRARSRRAGVPPQGEESCATPPPPRASAPTA